MKLAMQYLRQYMELLNSNHLFDSPAGVVQGLQSLARIVYSNAELLGGVAEASKGAETALKVCIRCLVRFESDGSKSLASDIQRAQAMAINVRNGVGIMEVSCCCISLSYKRFALASVFPLLLCPGSHLRRFSPPLQCS